MYKKREKPKPTHDHLKLKIKRLTACGSIVLFFSWAFQNYFQEKWKSEIERIERTKAGISVNEINKNLYKIYMNEIEGKPIVGINDKANLLNAYQGYDIYANMLFYLGTTLTTDSLEYLNNNHILFKNNIRDINKWTKNGEVNKLKWFADRLSKWEGLNGIDVINGYQYRLLEIRKREEFWNNAYLICYIFGALILSYAFTIEYGLEKGNIQQQPDAINKAPAKKNNILSNKKR